MTTAYERGRAFEYKRKKHWEALGYEVLRTAGSHGKWDLITISPRGGVGLIQCKRVQTVAEANRLIAAYKANPPRIPGYHDDFDQGIEVYVTDTREVLDGWI